jgi:hypothetical protein
VRYQELIPMLLNELQRQQKELAELRAIVGSLQRQRGASEAAVSDSVSERQQKTEAAGTTTK